MHAENIHINFSFVDQGEFEIEKMRIIKDFFFEENILCW